MSLAKIIALADQVAALIEAEWGPSGNDSVERLYEAPVSVSELDTLIGRKVYVFPIRKTSLGAADHGSDRFNWSIGVTAVERRIDAGIVSTDWMDERTLWMEEVVEVAVDFDGREDAGGYLEFDGRKLWTASIETEIYDVDHLQEKLFWSTMEIVFDEIAEV